MVQSSEAETLLKHEIDEISKNTANGLLYLSSNDTRKPPAIESGITKTSPKP